MSHIWIWSNGHRPTAVVAFSFLFACLLSVVAPLSAQDQTAAVPDVATPAKARAADRVLENIRSFSHVPGVSAAVMIDCELVSTQACHAYFVKTEGAPSVGKTWSSKGDASPVVGMRLRDAHGFASGAQDEVEMALPSTAELALAKRSDAVVTRSNLREMLRPNDAPPGRRPGSILVGGKRETRYWRGSDTVGFRCCYPLRRAPGR